MHFTVSYARKMVLRQKLGIQWLSSSNERIYGCTLYLGVGVGLKFEEIFCLCKNAPR